MSKLNIGCGKSVMEGFDGVDSIDFGQKYVGDAIEVLKGMDADSVEEVHCSHFIEHLTADKRIELVNELYRVMAPDAKCTMIAPHWASCRAYGDLTHQWPPVSEFWFYYLSKQWRVDNAPHSPYDENVNFECTWGYGLNPAIATRNAEYQQFAMANYKEAITDIIATLIKRSVG